MRQTMMRERMPLTSKLIPIREPNTATLTGSLQARRNII